MLEFANPTKKFTEGKEFIFVYFHPECDGSLPRNLFGVAEANTTHDFEFATLEDLKIEDAMYGGTDHTSWANDQYAVLEDGVYSYEELEDGSYGYIKI